MSRSRNTLNISALIRTNVYAKHVPWGDRWPPVHLPWLQGLTLESKPYTPVEFESVGYINRIDWIKALGVHINNRMTATDHVPEIIKAFSVYIRAGYRPLTCTIDSEDQLYTVTIYWPDSAILLTSPVGILFSGRSWVPWIVNFCVEASDPVTLLWSEHFGDQWTD